MTCGDRFIPPLPAEADGDGVPPAHVKLITCWVYVSTSCLGELEDEAALAAIVEVSRRRNAALGITGALLHTRHRFAQIIEGPADAVAAVRASIERDPRHHDIRTLDWSEHEARLFAGWSLAYAGPSHYVDGIVESALAEADRAASRAMLVRLLRGLAA